MRALLFYCVGATLACSGAAPSPSPSDPTPARSPSGEEVPGTPAQPPAQKSSPGCGRPAKAGTLTQREAYAGGKARSYHVAIPRDYVADRPHAIVFVLHGAGDTSP